ncbi:MAG TPA: phosphatidate cytidylyltransferase [Blastocatellia bacterium]|nr:phosphatidate cytidylyltransferase [Blastocatellia bacterium]
MKSRIITAIVALPILFGSIILPLYVAEAIWFFAAIAIAAIAAGLFEFYALTKKMELKADASIGFLGASGFLAAFVFDAPSKAPDLLFITIFVFLGAILISQAFRFRQDFTKLLAGASVTFLGVMYVVFLGGFLISIATGFTGSTGLSSKLLLFFFIVVFASDIGAYFTGRAFGKHKLAPSISPGKTWEGTIGGVAFACGFAALSTYIFFPELKIAVSIPLGGIMAIVGGLGDLAESAMKRGAKTKDAANILPGHGGILDRLDSLLLNAPLLYYFARFYF